MKKHYSITRGLLKGLAVVALAAGLTVPASARQWDFTKWSPETVADIKAADVPSTAIQEREWSSQESASKTDDLSDKTYWCWTSNGSTSEPKEAVANGNSIKELTGLYYLQTGHVGSLAISFDRAFISGMSNDGRTDGGTDYHGAAYLWLGGKGKDYFLIPSVPLGTIIKAGVESHKSSAARGIELYVAKSDEKSICVRGTKLLDPDGKAVSTPKLYTEQTWVVPAEAGKDDRVNEDGTVDIVIYNTDGCHLYYIDVQDGKGGDVVEADKKIAFVTPDREKDDLDFAVAEGFEVTAFGADATISADDLKDLEAILISNQIKSTDPVAASLKALVARFPMVNASANLAEAWGYATFTATDATAVEVAEADAENAIFADLETAEGLELLADGTLSSVTAGDYLKNDLVLATIGEAPYLLQHNAGRNSHILIPFAEDAALNGDVLNVLVANALKVAANTKKAVTAAATPAIKPEQGDGKTTVTITSSNGGTIRYVTYADDADPKPVVTEESTEYTAPLEFTESTNIIAKVFGVDGYDPSNDMPEPVKVVVAAKATAPAIEYDDTEEGKTVITLTTNHPNADIHFSFAGQTASTRTDVNKTQKYTEPITVYEPTTIYAFVNGEGILPSDLVSQKINIKGIDNTNIRIDTLSHFSAGDSWKEVTLDGKDKITGLSKYYIGIHKSQKDTPNDGASENFGFSGDHSQGWKYWSDEVESTEEVEQQAKNDDGSLKFEADGTTAVMEKVTVTHYKVDPASYHEITCAGESDWKVVSEGQNSYMDPTLTVDLNVQDLSKGIDDINKPVGLVNATDLVSLAPTKGTFQWKGKLSGHPYNARIESTRAFDAPFDIVLFTRQGGKDNEVHSGKVLYSVDGKEWKAVDNGNDGVVSTGSRLRSVNKHRMSIEGEGKYYVRVEHNGQAMQLHDIFIMNNGALSKEYSGIEDVIANEGAEVIAVEYYNLGGIRIAEPTEGFFIKRSTLSNGQVLVEKLVK